MLSWREKRAKRLKPGEAVCLHTGCNFILLTTKGIKTNMNFFHKSNKIEYLEIHE